MPIVDQDLGIVEDIRSSLHHGSRPGTVVVTVREHLDCTVYDWCTDDHSCDETELDRSYHRKTLETGGIEVDFILDGEGPRIYWEPGFYWTFKPDELDDLNEISAAFLAIRAEFTNFLREVTK